MSKQLAWTKFLTRTRKYIPDYFQYTEIPYDFSAETKAEDVFAHVKKLTE